MKSRTNAQQELMRQQMIEEERNRQNQKCQNNRVLPQTIKCGRLLNAIPQMTAAAVTKRQRSSSDVSQLKIESFSPTNKSPMDLAFTSLANDHDALDWSQIEPSITTTSDISPQEILEQITRSQNNDSIPEMQMETGTEENDSLQDDQSVSSLKPSTSCPANMANPFHVSSSGAPSVLIKYHQFTSQKQSNHNPATVSSGRSSVTNPTQIVTSIPTGLPEDQKLQWVRDRTKKDCHNRIERKRRDYINNQIQELGQLLPEKLFLSTESKRNKGGILKNSVLYIQQLQDSVNCIPHLQKEAQISENLISELYKNNQSLRNLVKSNSQISCEIPVVDKKLLQDWFDTHQNNSQLLQKINSAQLPWPAENSHREKLSVYTNYDDVSVLDISAENVLNSISIPREQTINSGGASSSGTPITNYSSPITNTSTTIASSNRSRHTPVTNMTNNIITVNSPQQYQSHIYGSSQPFSKSNFRLYEQTQSKPGITDSPVLSSILIGSGNSNNGVKTFSELQSSSKHNATVIGHSSSVPDEPRIGFFSQSSENNSGERFYLIPITKAIKTKGLVKVETDFSYSEDPVISKIHSEPINSPRNKVINTYKIGQISHEEEEVHNCIEISPDQIDNDDSLMGEFEFDDIQME